jgi:hypothetical protein
MKKCKFENLIDDYLLNRIDDKQKEAFEEHYFNCSHCYELLEAKNEMIAAIKAKGDEIFQNVYAPEKIRRTWLEPVLAFLTPRQWAMAAVTAALILVVAVGIIPNLKTGTPEFFVTEDQVRSSSINLISPVTDNLDRIPSEFRWQRLTENTEYKLFIYHQEELLWSTATKENFVILSENIKSQMTSDKEYSWQVKAFSPEGTLIAVSSRAQFTFLPQK